VVEAPYDLRFRWAGIPLPRVRAGAALHRARPGGGVRRKRRVALAVRWSAMEDDRISLDGLLGSSAPPPRAEIGTRFRTLVTPGINVVPPTAAGDVV
jgi:hypothetical protein